VRELASVIERAAILGDGQRLEVERALGAGPLSPPPPAPPPSSVPSQAIEPLEVVTRRHIERALAQTLGRVEGPFGAARLLDIHPDTLRSRMRKLGIERAAFRH
jgi:DNA-binding NtrC family response regulator